MSTARADIDVAGLLTIDVDSELRKLSSAQFQGPWQLPAELVRRALRRGAQRVHMESGRQRVQIVDDGIGFTVEHLQWTASLLDAGQTNELRHSALTRLESEGELTLLGLFGLQCRQIEIHSAGPHGEARLLFQRGQPPQVQASASPRPPQTRVVLSAPALDRRQVVQWMHNVARFAPATIVLDGKPINRGFDDTIAHAPLLPPLQGRVAVPKESDSAHVWLLEHGLVTAHITVPEAPAFEAAVELGTDAVDLSAARLREAIAPHIKELIEQASRLLVELGQTFTNRAFPEPVRAQVARLALQSAHKRLQFDAILELPLFRAVDADGYRLLDLQTLRRSASRDASGSFIAPALYPNQKPERFVLGRTPILIADAMERSRIAELMQIRFRPPESRDSRGSLRNMLWRGFDRLRDQSRSLALWVRHPWRARPIADDALTPVERAFLEILRHELLANHARQPRYALANIQLCHGTGPVRRTAGVLGTLQLPRENPEVRAAIAAVTSDPAWVYPVALVLLDGHVLPPPAARNRWLERRAAATGR